MTTPWSVPAMWKGGECYIIGGGSSLLKNFSVPVELGRAVQQGKEHPSALSQYLAPIHDKHVIGINSAFLLGPWQDVIFFGDSSWYDKNKYALATFPAIKVTCCPDSTPDRFQDAEIKWVTRDRSQKGRKHQGLSDDPTSVIWNYHSGGAAINLAYHFGVKKIYLIGFDMQADENGHTHWHGEYRRKSAPVPPRKREKGTGKVPKAPFNRHLRVYEQLAVDAKMRGLQIVNLSPTTAIKVFPYEVPSWQKI